MTTIRLALSIPPSANRYWRVGHNGQVHVSEEAKEYKAYVRWHIMENIHVVEPLTEPLKLEMIVYRARKAGDLDNYIKVLTDALAGMLFVDDKQIVEIHAWRRDDPQQPRVEVTLTTLSGAEMTKI